MLWGYTPAEIQGFCDKYGRLYYWETAKTACPSGWRLPSDADWDQLKSFVNELRGDEFGLFDLRDTSWGNSEDKYGFSALPGGYGYSPGGAFYFEAKGSSCVLWSRSASDEGNSILVYGSVSFVGNERLISVRCIKDN